MTGDLGGAYLGLQILERENSIFQKNELSQPDLSPYSVILERQLTPEPRLDIIRNLEHLHVTPTSMIDVSDGLGSELIHLSNASEKSLRVFADKIPLSPITQKTAKELNLDPIVCALNGGEDYELLFTINLKDYKKIQDTGLYTAIGHISDKKNKVELIANNNKSVNLKDKGWDSFSKVRRI